MVSSFAALTGRISTGQSSEKILLMRGFITETLYLLLLLLIVVKCAFFLVFIHYSLLLLIFWNRFGEDVEIVIIV